MIFFDAAQASSVDGLFSQKEDRKAIVIMRALPGLGDFLCVVPALRALRTAYPEAHIALIGLRGTSTLAARFNHYIDSFLAFPGFPGLKEQPVQTSALIAFLGALNGRFDLALQLHGSGIISNIFTMLLEAAQTAGFYLPGQYCPDPRTFLYFSDQEPEILRSLRLIKLLDVPLQGYDLEFPLTDEDYDAYELLRQTWDLTEGRFICLHPGASDTARRWPAASFAAVADILAEQGFQIVLTGSLNEQPLTWAVAEAMKYPVVDLAGQTTLGVLASLLNNATLLVSNDTGVAHLAAALSVPSVTIYQSSNPARWAALNRQRHRIVVAGERRKDDWGSEVGCANGQALLTRPAVTTFNSPSSNRDGTMTDVLTEINGLLYKPSLSELELESVDAV